MRIITAIDIDKLYKRGVVSINLVKLFYVHYGRNAWNSTWIQRYTNGCMHLSFSSACEYAERNRVSGSVFYIREIPSIWICGEKFNLFVTEINTDKPLFKYQSEISQVEKSFKSIFEFFTPKTKNSILRLTSENKDGSPDIFHAWNLPFSQYVSVPRGNRELLDWNSTVNKTQFDAVLYIVKYFNRELEKEDVPIRVGQKKADVSRIFGPPSQIKRNLVKDLALQEKEVFHEYPIEQEIEKWLYNFVNQKVEVFFCLIGVLGEC